MKMYPVQYCDLANGETMAYRSCGNPQNQTLLLIHGNQSASIFFSHTMQALEAEAHLVAIDMIGFGDSSYRHPKNTLADFAADVALFMEAMGLTDVIILGWSTGGGVAMELAIGNPAAVRHIILLSSVGMQGYAPYHTKNALGAFDGKRLWAPDELARESRFVGPSLHALQTMNRAFLKKSFDLTVYHVRKPPEAEYQLYLDAMMQERCLLDVYCALAAFNITHEAIGNVPGDGRMDRLRCPVTILHGRQDRVIRVEEAVKTAERLGSRARLIIFEEAGHALLHDQPEAFYKVLRQVLAQHRKI